MKRYSRKKKKSYLQKQWDKYEKRILEARIERDRLLKQKIRAEKNRKNIYYPILGKPFLDYENMGLIGSVNWHSEYNVSPEAGDYSHVFWDYSDEDYWRIVSIKKPHWNGKVVRKGK